MTVWFKPEAIGNRLAGYGLTELEHAIESIVRETVFSLSPSLEPEDPSNRIHVNGGVDERISVKWSGEAAAQAKKLFPKRGKHRAFVKESHERWLNRFGRKEARV